MGRLTLVTVGLLWGACSAPAPTRSPCEGFDCGPGRCVALEGAPACLCDSGFTAGPDLTCVAINLCTSSPCAALRGGLCLQGDRGVTCECPEGTVSLAGTCTPRSPCTPNPCTELRRTSCELLGGVAVCRCEPGFAPEGTGCTEAPVWSCSAQHSGSPREDASEPDECPPLAPTVDQGATVSRTLAPAGDNDWFSVPVTAGHIVGVTAVSTVPVLLDVFDATGVQVMAADGRGFDTASVEFVAVVTGTALVRVRALDATRTGEYTLSLSDLGLDDFSSAPDDTQAIAPGARFEGQVQFPGDVDAVWFDVPGQVAVKLESLRLPTGGTVTLELQRQDGTHRTLLEGQTTIFSTPTDERLRLVARGTTSGDVGPFSLGTAPLGPDDASDDPLFAMPLLADGRSRSGVLERRDDVDSFVLSVSAGRVYRARWQSLTGTSLAAVSVAEHSGALVVASRPGLMRVSWKAPTSDALDVLVRDSLVGSQPGAYALSIDDLGVDDYADTSAGASPVSYQTPISGRIDFDDDVDVFSVTPTAGHLLRVTVDALPPGVATASVLDPAGNASAWLPSSTLPVTTPGVHYLRVRAPNLEPVSYTLTVSDVGLDDHGDTPATATPVGIGAWVNGETQFDTDLDLFSFSPLAGHVYQLDCGLPATRCSVLDPSGTRVTGNWTTEAPRFLASAAGTWWARLSGPPVAPYSFRIDDLGPEDHGETTATATPLPDGGVVSGEMGFEHDVDVFSFNAVASRIYTATLQQQSTRPLWLQQRTATGALVREVTGAPLSFVSPVSGPAYFSVFNGSLTATDLYTVTLTEGGLDDHGNEAATATALALEGTAMGALEYQGDEDVFRVPVVAGHHQRVRASSSSGVLTLRVETPAGGVIAALDYEGNVAELTFRTPAQVTEVLVRIFASGAPVSYSLVTEDVGPDDFPDSIAEATPLTLGIAVSGTLEVNTDVDAFSLAVTSGQLIAASCASATNPGCEVRVRSPAGTEIAPGFPGFRANQSGLFSLEVHGTAGPWVLVTTTVTDDYGNDSATASPLTLGARQSGTNEYFEDVDVFSFSVPAGSQLVVEPPADCRTVLRDSSQHILLVLDGVIGTVLLPDAGPYFVSVRGCPQRYSLLVSI